MIRPASVHDRAAILQIAQASGLFSLDELPQVGAMFDMHRDADPDEQHHWLVDDDGPAAVAYFAPEPFSDAVWNLYMLAVDPAAQGEGRGAALVSHVEAAVRAAGGRIVLIETSGVPDFERTREFYRRCDYAEEARIREYYGPGDDKVVFWKKLSA